MCLYLHEKYHEGTQRKAQPFECKIWNKTKAELFG